MRSFHFHPLVAAILLSALTMGILGAFVVLPIACINWTWNSIAAHFSVMPEINAWQAGLLYVAGACIVYLLGWIQIEFKTGMLD